MRWRTVGRIVGTTLLCLIAVVVIALMFTAAFAFGLVS